MNKKSCSIIKFRMNEMLTLSKKYSLSKFMTPSVQLLEMNRNGRNFQNNYKSINKNCNSMIVNIQSK